MSKEKRCCCFKTTCFISAVCCLSTCFVLAALFAARDANWEHWNRNATESGGACPIAYNPTYLEPIAQAARAAFCRFEQADRMRTWDCDPCKKSGLEIVNGTYRQIYGDYFSDNSTYAYAVKLSKKQGLGSHLRSQNELAGACLIAFRGTMNFANGMTNIDTMLYPMGAEYNCPNCLVHHGFFSAWRGMEEETVTILNELGCNRSSLIITGHSLGAAIATFATWTLTQVYGFPVRMFYSFESPRVGDPAFHYFFNDRIVAHKPAFRFTYYNDAVVHVPPVEAGFEHVNCEIHYDRMGNYSICSDTEDKACADSWDLQDWDTNINGGPDGGAHCHVSYISSGDICWC